MQKFRHRPKKPRKWSPWPGGSYLLEATLGNMQLFSLHLQIPSNTEPFTDRTRLNTHASQETALNRVLRCGAATAQQNNRVLFHLFETFRFFLSAEACELQERTEALGSAHPTRKQCACLLMQRVGWGGHALCHFRLHRNSGLARRITQCQQPLLMALQSLSAFTVFIHFKWT